MSIRELDSKLKGLLGKSICADVVSNISSLTMFGEFDYWMEKGKLILTSEDEEVYMYLNVPEIDNVDVGIFDDVNIHMSNGNAVVLYQN